MTEPLFGSVDRDPRSVAQLVGVLTAVTRYDLALGLIPIAFVAAAVGTYGFGFAPALALIPAAVVGVLVIVDVCYLNPPVEPDGDD